MKWFVIRVVTGKEKKVKELIEFELNDRNLTANLLIPMEKSIKIKNGKKVNVEKTFMPGYIFIECDSISELEFIIKRINGVASVLKQPLSQREIERFLIKKDKSEEDTSDEMFYLEQKVKIIDGPFNTFIGTIKKVDNKTQKVKVSISIFGTETNIDLKFQQIVSL